jgi:8-amino-7-oxononanoate synthase
VWNLDDELRAIREGGLFRELRTLASGQGASVLRGGALLANFSSNDYLGLAASDELKAALKEGVDRFGAGSGASRLVCGSLAPHEELEVEIASFKGSEAALSFSSGYAVALGTIPALLGKDDVIILDKLCHASLVDAARLSGATVRVFPHNHLEKLERLLSGAADGTARPAVAPYRTPRVLVVTESIFSMDGDAAALSEIVELKDRHGAWLMLDEAHAVGVIGPQGRGLAAELGLEKRVELQMGTLSKAVGLSGGYLAASRSVISLLINKARSFIYSTAPPPAVAFAARESLRLIQCADGEGRREKLRRNRERWEELAAVSPGNHALASAATRSRLRKKVATAHQGGSTDPALACAATGGAIYPVIVGDESRAMDLSSRLLDQGFLVPAIRFPTVARGSARLRVTLSAAHELVQIEALAVSLRSAMAELAGE